MTLHDSLLQWYDKEHRILPWRALPGQLPNPYFVLLSEIMLQQTTVATVMGYFEKFIKKWPTLDEFSGASLDEVYHAWQGLGYYSRVRNLHKCVQVVKEKYAGQIPADPDTLLSLPGVGPYTAAAIAAIGYNYPIVPVDGNIIRVFSRLLRLETPLPRLQQEVRILVNGYTPSQRSGDFAQALMDLGAIICKPRNPVCEKCPIQYSCKVALTEEVNLFPRKKAKQVIPTLYGVVFWYEAPTGEIWLRRRPEKGLLANLMEFPGLDWRQEPYKMEEILANSFNAENLTILSKVVMHTFTHFHLQLTVVKAVGTESIGEISVLPEKLGDYALPTLMKKVVLTATSMSN